jgi:hypothetical protein
MKFRIGAVVFSLLLLAGGADAASQKLALLDRLAVEQGSAKVNLPKGTVSLKANLAPLPATVDTGTGTFQATLYRAYLTSSTDASTEIPLGAVYPPTSGKFNVKYALSGDISLLGLDRVVVVAFSKDGQSSFDVLTGTIVTE